MADPKSYIGAVVQISAATPATQDNTGFAALSYTTIGKVVSVGAVGDQAADISQATLAGRVFHANGAIDGGAVPFEFLYDSAGDAGVTIVVANNNTNNVCSFKITDPDGKITYFYGIVASFQDNERSPTSFKGFNFIVRVNSVTVRPAL